MDDKRPVVPTYCFFQGCYDPDYEREIAKGKALCYEFNRLHPNDRAGQTEVLSRLLGRMGKDAIFTPQFWCDYGYNIEVGDSFYANHNLVITDGAKVTFGDNVFIAPNCCFTTAEHPTDPELRKAGIEVAKPIRVGNNVWIGAGSTVLAGVTIGDDSVIGAGSVVTRDIPSGVVACGVPCRVMRKIGPDDRTRYPMHESLSGKFER